MTVTIRDIAKKLNLSVGAVSRALDGYPDISVETRRRVAEAAREMGYFPNSAARQLRRQKSDTIGYIMPVSAPRFADSFFSELIEGLGDETTSQGYDLLISTAEPGSEKEKRIYQSWVQGQKVDGLVIDRVLQDDWRIQYLKTQKMPFASFETAGECSDHACVMVDSYQGFIRLVEHIAEQGFRRLAYVGGPDNLKIQADRFAGFQEGLKQCSLPFYSEYVMAGDLTSESGYSAAQRLLALPRPPDAFLCVNDETAFGVMGALHDAHRVIGEEVAVAGFDGVRESRYSNPPLTTMDQPVYDIARQLVKMLTAELSGHPLADNRVVIQPNLIIRASTGSFEHPS